MPTKQIHYISGLVLTCFIGLHLFNHIYSVVGIEEHIRLMNSLRIVYRNIIVESLIILAVIVQIISGIKLFRQKRKNHLLFRQKRKNHLKFFGKMHIWTGLYLAFFLLLHTSAIFFGRLVMELDTNFYYGVIGLNTFPLNLFFIPYYALAIFSFFGHIASIHYQKMKKSILGISPKKQSYAILLLGIFITMVIFYGSTNHFNGVEIPEEYYKMYE